MTQHMQELMDAAYDGWQANPRKTYRDFLFDLPVDQKEAVLIGNLNYQVENGGFSQWILNGYGAHYEAVLTVLERINTDTSRAAYELIDRKVAPFIHYEHGEVDFNAADDAFYALNDQLIADADAYLAAKAVHV